MGLETRPAARGLSLLVSRLYKYRPRFRDRSFWITQLIVIAIAGIHDFIEVGHYLIHMGALYFVPVSLFFIPVVYAALNFGFPGSVTTAVWAVIITIPNLVLFHSGVEMIGDMFQMSLIVLAAIFIGQRVDRESIARQQAEAAGDALRAYAGYVVGAQEEERQRIARELHDDTIQTLSLLCRRLEGMRDVDSPLPPAAVEGLKQSQQIAEDTVKTLRDFARSLRPAILDDLGIIPSIRRLLADFSERAGVGGELKLAGKEARLPPEVETGMFRIAQEALWNVERHSKATRVTISVTLAEDKAVLEIEDNGVGFSLPEDFSSFSTDGHLGLLGMQERAKLLGGEFQVQSRPGKGTTVTVSIPIQGGKRDRNGRPSTDG